MNDYLTTEARTLDTISREISAVVNELGHTKGMDEAAINELWHRLYAIRNRAYDAVIDSRASS